MRLPAIIRLATQALSVAMKPDCSESDMGEGCCFRNCDGRWEDVTLMMDLLRQSYVRLDPDFLEAGLGFSPEQWTSHICDPQTQWVICYAKENGQPAGFAGWRNLSCLSHLHALFVADAFQHQGFGRAMLRRHWETAQQRVPGITLFTLHVRESAPWAHSLYLHQGYQDYLAGDESKWPALAVWIDSCREYGSWPLPLGKRLMFRPMQPPAT